MTSKSRRGSGSRAKPSSSEHLQKLIVTAKNADKQQDPEDLANEFTRLYHRSIKRDMEDLKKRLREIGVDCAKAVFLNQVKLSALGATWGVIQPEPTAVSPNRVALMGVAAAAQAWDDINKTRKTMKEARSRSAEISFLLRAQRSLGSPASQPELFSKVKRAYIKRKQVVTLNLWFPDTKMPMRDSALAFGCRSHRDRLALVVSSLSHCPEVIC